MSLCRSMTCDVLIAQNKTNQFDRNGIAFLPVPFQRIDVDDVDTDRTFAWSSTELQQSVEGPRNSWKNDGVNLTNVFNCKS